MNKTVKFIVIILGSSAALCLCIIITGWLALMNTGRVMSKTIDTDPNRVTTIGGDIADFTIPAGFGQGQAVRLADFSMVTYTTADGRTHILLFQAPAALALDKDELERQMGLATGKEEWNEVTVIETQPCQIRGDEAALVISEGVSHDGQVYRSASAVFEGNEGTALVNFSGPANQWDQEMVDAFIASLR